MKKILFLDSPNEAAFFLDHKDGSYFVRLEGMDLRIVIPLAGNLQHELGSLVDEFNEVVSKVQRN